MVGHGTHNQPAGTWSDDISMALATVNPGDDTDTTGAVAGALAGIAYGAAAIPQEWMAALRGKDVIERCLF